MPTKKYKGDWKEQLLAIKEEMEKKESGAARENDEESATVFSELRSEKIHLLPRSIQMGTVEGTVLVSSYSIRKFGWKELDRLNISYRKVHGEYLILTGVTLLGATAEYLGKSPDAAFANAAKELKLDNSKLIGPSVQMSGHSYILTLPITTYERGVRIYSWGFPANATNFDNLNTEMDVALV